MKEMYDRLKKHKAGVIGMEEGFHSSVCIPLIEKEGQIFVLFEVRSSKILKQPGDICFPGGKIEAGESSEQAAIREMMEELLVERGQISILSLMDVFYRSGLVIYPYAVLLSDYENTFQKDEVAETFLVPFSFFLETKPEEYLLEGKLTLPDDFPYERIVGGKNYRFRPRQEKMYFYQYGKRTIWGITAQIMKSFAEIWKKLEKRERKE